VRGSRNAEETSSEGAPRRPAEMCGKRKGPRGLKGWGKKNIRHEVWGSRGRERKGKKRISSAALGRVRGSVNDGGGNIAF